MTEASEGCDKKPKVSLLKIYREQIIPNIEEKVVQSLNMNGEREVLVVKQEDGAGVHRSTLYKVEMERMFQERDWILFNQPPNSPITNVHDACIFPMMSKSVSRCQAVNFGCRVLKSEQLHSTVMQVWDDETNREAMARAFAGHHQVVSAIMEDEGDNKYYSGGKGLSFGVRKAFVKDDDGDGVVAVRLSPERFEETDQFRVVDSRRCVRMKFSVPRMEELNKAVLTNEMERILKMHMDVTLMDDEVKAKFGDFVSDMGELVPM